ncbi:hypothetical protein ACQP04_23170 [Pseudonocardia halophobica]
MVSILIFGAAVGALAKDIQSGAIPFAIDQQPYVQGYMRCSRRGST